MNKNKTLYFEGAGMFYEGIKESNVGNYRIRTAFNSLDGIQYYIELGRGVRREKGASRKTVISSEWALRIDHLFKIEDRHKEELSTGGYEINKDHQAIAEYDYTKEGITEWINKNLNCDFDTIEVLHMFYGYRVHADNRGYNLIDDHDINHELAEKRKSAYEKVDMEYRKLTNEKYSVIGLLKMDDNSITVRCHASDIKIGLHPRVKKIEIV